MTRRVGGLLVKVAGVLRATAVRLESAPTPACWRCGRQLFPGAGEMELVPGDREFPWVWCCPGCVTDEDRAAIADTSRR